MSRAEPESTDSRADNRLNENTDEEYSPDVRAVKLPDQEEAAQLFVSHNFWEQNKKNMNQLGNAFKMEGTGAQTN